MFEDNIHNSKAFSNSRLGVSSKILRFVLFIDKTSNYDEMKLGLSYLYNHGQRFSKLKF